MMTNSSRSATTSHCEARLARLFLPVLEALCHDREGYLRFPGFNDLARSGRLPRGAATAERRNEIASLHCLPDAPCSAFIFDYQNTKGHRAKRRTVRQEVQQKS